MNRKPVVPLSGFQYKKPTAIVNSDQGNGSILRLRFQGLQLRFSGLGFKIRGKPQTPNCAERSGHQLKGLGSKLTLRVQGPK